MRSFNIAGPCLPDRHYTFPPIRRFYRYLEPVDRQAYFVVHAPRQTGLTTTMKGLAKHLREGGRYAALCFSCEEGRAFPEDVDQAVRAVWLAIEEAARFDLPEALRPPDAKEVPPGGFLRVQLSRWAEVCPLPLVLIFDEIDSLVGNSLKSVLSQLRAGHNARPAPFPQSVILCGARDVRDYEAASGGAPLWTGSSSLFNIKEESLRLGNFTERDVGVLYSQHTDATGQVFTDEAVARAWELGRGQPWLTNALAREVVEKMRVPAAEPITAAHIDEAKEKLIQVRATHLDSLVARLQEQPVRCVLEPILAGELPYADSLSDDLQYVTDLGLIAPDPPLQIANPIYREIIFRVLASGAERAVPVDLRCVVGEDGRLDIGRLLDGFADFWSEHGEVLAGRVKYPEVAAQLILMAYLQRVVNGAGFIDREVGVGRKRIDLSICWPYVEPGGQRAVQRAAMELKVWRERDRKVDPLPQGLVQFDEYLARLGLDEGALVIFDLRSAAPPVEERTRIEEAQTPSGRRVTVLRA